MTDETQELRAAGRATGLLWVIGGVSGALWYLMPVAALEAADTRLRQCKRAGKDRWEAPVTVGA